MGRNKELRVMVSESVADEFDRLKTRTNRNDSEIVNDALLSYLREVRRNELFETMKIGYENMGDLNLRIAEMEFQAEQNGLESYEMSLVSGRD